MLTPISESSFHSRGQVTFPAPLPPNSPVQTVAHNLVDTFTDIPLTPDMVYVTPCTPDVIGLACNVVSGAPLGFDNTNVYLVWLGVTAQSGQTAQALVEAAYHHSIPR